MHGRAKARVKIVCVDLDKDLWTWFIWVGQIRMRSMHIYKHKRFARRCVERWCKRFSLEIEDVVIRNEIGIKEYDKKRGYK